ncbi:MAG: MFS transporter [Bacilli bacterium]|nr:MFS transporter [Bacilli bacterium]
MRNNLKKNDLRILVLCWATYLVAYLCRLNFASALMKISDGLAIASEIIGIIPSVYFIVYAFGQLLNGFIGDRVNPYAYIATALVITATANLFISLSNSFIMILLFWSLNGFSQSMFWGSLLRLLSWNFDKSKHKTVATSMSLSSIIAGVLSWSVLGTVLTNSSWQHYFLIPSVIAMIFLTLWLVFSRNYATNRVVDNLIKTVTLKNTIQILVKEKLYYICFLCFCLGFIKEGLAVWAPTIFMQSLGLRSEQSLWYLMSVPIANLAGLVIVRKVLSHSRDNNRKTMLILLALMGTSAIILLVLGVAFPALNIGFISIITALANGSIWIVISLLPLSFSSRGMVSTIVGLFDFSIYMGASLASVFLGVLLSLFGWVSIPTVWVFFSLSAILLCLGTAGACLVSHS